MKYIRVGITPYFKKLRSSQQEIYIFNSYKIGITCLGYYFLYNISIKSKVY